MAEPLLPADVGDGFPGSIDFTCQPLGDERVHVDPRSRRQIPPRWHLRALQPEWHTEAAPTSPPPASSAASGSPCRASAQRLEREGLSPAIAEQIASEGSSWSSKRIPEGSLLAARGDGFAFLAAGANAHRLRAARLSSSDSDHLPDSSIGHISNPSAMHSADAASAPADIDAGKEFASQRILQVEASHKPNSPFLALRHERTISCMKWHLPCCTWEDGVSVTLSVDGYEQLMDSALNPVLDGELLTISEHGAAYTVDLGESSAAPSRIRDNDAGTVCTTADARGMCCCFTSHPRQALHATGQCISLLDLRTRNHSCVYTYASKEEEVRWLTSAPSQTSSRASIVCAVSSSYVSLFDPRMLREPLLRWRVGALPDGSSAELAHPAIYCNCYDSRFALVCSSQHGGELFSFPFDWSIGKWEMSQSMLDTPAFAESAGDVLRIKRRGRLKGLSITSCYHQGARAKILGCTDQLELCTALVGENDGSSGSMTTEPLPIGDVFKPPSLEEDQRAASYEPSDDDVHISLIKDAHAAVAGGKVPSPTESETMELGSDERCQELMRRSEVSENLKVDAASETDVVLEAAQEASDIRKCVECRRAAVVNMNDGAVHRRSLCIPPGMWSRFIDEYAHIKQLRSHDESKGVRQSAWAICKASADAALCSCSSGCYVPLLGWMFQKEKLPEQSSELEQNVLSEWDSLEERIHADALKELREISFRPDDSQAKRSASREPQDRAHGNNIRDGHRIDMHGSENFEKRKRPRQADEDKHEGKMKRERRSRTTEPSKSK